MACECVAHTDIGRLRHRAGEQLGRHRHDIAFAAVVLAGTYLEAGDRGRMRARPGDVILHDAFESHLNQVDQAGAEVLVLPWRTDITLALGRVRDPDSIARLAERDARAAATLLEAELVLRPAETFDWPDRLAADLRRDPDIALDEWAMGANLRPESVSRGFRRAYGVTAMAFRARSRTLRALTQVSSGRPLAQVAVDCGFADQAHFTRSFRLLTGTTPGRWTRIHERSARDAGGTVFSRS